MVRECPECGSDFLDRDEVDIGIGVQHGPWRCTLCGWTEEPVPGSLRAMLDDLEHEEEPF